MSLIRYIYKTKTLSEYGRFIFISLLLLVAAGNIFIPEYQVQNVDTQLLRLKGKHFTYSDDLHIREFISSVKRHNGYVCMGTSESTTLRDGNYYEFLDQDTSYGTRFSILGGAGRTCGLHMPMLINYADDVDSLKVIYFINPVYWRSELKGFNKGYWTRYLNRGAYRKTIDNSRHQDFMDITREYDQVLNIGEKFLYRAEYWFRKIRKPFFHDLRYMLFPDKYYEDLQYLAEKKTGTSIFDHFGEIDTAYIDTSWNITHEFKNRIWLNPIEDDDYRYNELSAFIRLCRDLNVDVTFILGPVNEIFIASYQASYLDAYIQTVDNIRALLIEEGVDYIDVTDLGNLPGSFIDNQHHSSYGAFMIYQKTKKHLYEKDGL
ncbi:MAG: D-alanyl-lipoteichoic acid biosynthesis protein DltD [Bacteroidota bacterium]